MAFNSNGVFSNYSRYIRNVLSSYSDLSPLHNLKKFGRNPRADILAGMTVAIISIPMALAFGVASGLGAATGIWGTICGGLFVGLFGGSPVGISGPTSPKVVQLAMVMKEHVLADGSPDLGFAFSMVALSGVILLIFAFCRIGRFIYYTPYSVVSGFMCGIGLILILLQLAPMMGVEASGSLVDQFLSLPTYLQQANVGAVIISLASFSAILLWERFKPIRWFPSPLVGLGTGILLGQILPYRVDFLSMSTALPTVYMPDFSKFSDMVAPALSLSGLCLFDSLLTCLVADTMTNERHNSNRELFGQGIANIACGLIGGVTTATATMRTVANIKSGARSGLASIMMGLTMLTFMLGLAEYARFIPMACLAGILLKIAIDILDYRVIPVFKSLPNSDKLIFAVVLFLTISTDLLVAVGVGMMIAFIHFIQKVSHLYEPSVANESLDVVGKIGLDHCEDDNKNVVVISLNGPVFFGISDKFYQAMENLNNVRKLTVDLGSVNYMDLSGAYLLDDLFSKCKEQNIEVTIRGAKGPIEMMLRRLRVVNDCPHTSWRIDGQGHLKMQFVEQVQKQPREVLLQA